MQLTFKPARLTGFAILAVAGATALSLGACSTSNNAKPPTTPSPASANAKDSVHGLVASVSGNSVQVTQTTGTATVDVSASTKITEYTKAQLTDFAAGNCVSVNFKPGPNPDSASAVAVQRPTGGWRQVPATEECPAPRPGVIGTVVSVAGNTITVASTDSNGKPSQTNMNVADQTRYTKGATETSKAIAQDKCISASGNKDGGGTLQATLVTLVAANNGKCP